MGGREPRLPQGGRRLARVSLNHEEVEKSLEEGVRYIENLSPIEASSMSARHVRAVKFVRADGSVLEVPARTVCVAAGTSPNVTYGRRTRGRSSWTPRGSTSGPTGEGRNKKGDLVDARAARAPTQRRSSRATRTVGTWCRSTATTTRITPGASCGRWRARRRLPEGRRALPGDGGTGAADQAGREFAKRELFARLDGEPHRPRRGRKPADGDDRRGRRPCADGGAQVPAGAVLRLQNFERSRRDRGARASQWRGSRSRGRDRSEKRG